IRDFHVTGVQTCALPICCSASNIGLEGFGEVAERFNAAVSKAVVPQGTGGSNPSLSAKNAKGADLMSAPLAFLAEERGRDSNGRSEERRVGKEGRARWGE